MARSSKLLGLEVKRLDVERGEASQREGGCQHSACPSLLDGGEPVRTPPLRMAFVH